MSLITAMELLYGARDKKELKMLERFLELFLIIHFEPVVSQKALKLVTQFAKSHMLDIPDAFIAACCIQNNAELMTYNVKDFKFIPGLVLLK